MILSIDPGPIESAYTMIDELTLKPLEFGKLENHMVIKRIKLTDISVAAIEMIASYGMAVGKQIFDTCRWIGRFEQSANEVGTPVELIYRKDVKMHLCNSMKAKDANIRQALIDRFGIVGTRNNPGWFYGFSGDIWSAYAVGITFLEGIHYAK